MTTAIVVEDGTIVTGANSYVSAATLTAFATARGVTLATATDILILKAMDYLEPMSYKGLKRTRDQALEWPRLSVLIDGYYIDSTTIPQQLKDALCHTCIAIDQSNDPLQDAVRKTHREKVGDLEVEYSPGAISVVKNVRIMNVLAKLLNGGVGYSVAVGKG